MWKAFLMTLPVLAPFLLFYWLADPFKVLRSPAVFYEDTAMPQVGLNKGMVTVENFERQLKNGNKYNAFIFGSSISCYYDAEEWAAYFKEDSVAPYHFDSGMESLEQMAEKVNYLNNKGIPIKYALIILDPIIMAGETDDSPMSISPPQLSGNPLEWIKYHYTFFRASTNADFLKSWIPGRISGKSYFLGRNPVFEVQPIVYDQIHNQESIPLWDSLINSDKEKFYSEHPLLDSPDEITVSEELLSSEKSAYLKKIADIFKAQGTDYEVIIGPNRRKVVLNPQDKVTLDSIFGARKVHDFSRSFARDLETDSYLYDNTHYRPPYASKLMKLVYGSRNR